MSNITSISTATQLHQYTDNLYPISNHTHNTMKLKPVTPSKPKYTNQRGHEPSMPMKDKEDIICAKDYFLTKPERYQGQNLRDYSLFDLGINVGLRAGDLLHLHISDVMNGKIIIKEQKTINHNKPARVITLAEPIQQMLNDYIKILKQNDKYDIDNYLFQSRKGNNQPMSVKGFWDIIKGMSKSIQVNYNITTHSCRRTFAYQKLIAHKEDAMYLSTIQMVLGHSSPKVTLRYVGIEAEEIADVYMNDVL